VQIFNVTLYALFDSNSRIASNSPTLLEEALQLNSQPVNLFVSTYSISTFVLYLLSLYSVTSSTRFLEDMHAIYDCWLL